MRETWVIGSRGSKLALWQADFVRKAIQQYFPDFTIQIKVIKTSGDTRKWSKLWEMGGKGVFTKEIEDALFQGEIDLAVHSLKDLPTVLPKGLGLGAVPDRETPTDVLISKENVLLEHLPEGARLGTSSFRRRAQLLRLKPHLKMEEVRGNVPTRIRKVHEGLLDAVVIAKAGVVRLGLQEWITQEFSFDEILPAPGQGALAVEIREEDDEARNLLSPINQEDYFDATSGERSFLEHLGGGCRLPIAAYGEVQGEEFFLDGLVASPNGQKMVRKKISGMKKDSEVLGKKLAQQMLDEGVGEFLKVKRWKD
jgi:hydroxymethylbilane synthase